MDESDASKTQNSSARENVAARYLDNLKERQSWPDKIFYDGEGLEIFDSNLVVLSSDAHENPRTWSTGKKWTITVIAGTYCFLAPFASTIFTPSMISMMADLGETNPVLGALQIGIFLLAFAVAPIFLAPVSEIVGRRLVMTCGNIFFAIFCIGAGFCKTTAQLAVCRFLAGCGGAAAMAVYGGVLGDVWDLKGRGRASAIVGMAIIMGPVLGPACGGWISERASWRWTCWIPAMAAAVLELVATVFYAESYIPAILKHKLSREKRLRPGDDLYTVVEMHPQTKAKRGALSILESAGRPVMYLALDPALCLLAVYGAFVFGVLYLVFVTFQSVFGRGYGHSPGIVGLDLLSEGIGALIGVGFTERLLGAIYKRQIKGEYKSESRLISAFPGAVLVSAGLFVYGFTALRTHFMVPLVGMFLFSMGMINTFLAMQLYIIDSFDFPASAIAGFSILRCVFAGTFPLFGQRLFDALGLDWGVGLLAFLSLGLGGPFLPMLYFHGPRLREIGKKNRARFIG